MTPFVEINRSGKQVIDKSKREFLMNPLGNQPSTPGRYFLTAAYRMVNLDADSFTLWQANPSSSIDLVPVYDEEAAEQCSGDVPGLVQPSASASSSASASVSATPADDSRENEGNETESSNEEGISTAIIGGAVGGGVGALIVIGIAAFIILLRRRQREANAASGSTGQLTALPV